MDAVRTLTREHHRIEELFDRWLGGMEAGAERTGVLRDIVWELSAHMAAEEAAVHPMVARELPGERRIIDDLTREHDRILRALVKLEGADEADRGVEHRVADLIEEVRRHLKHEETELFPRLRALGPWQLDELASRLEDTPAALSGRG